MKPVAVVGRAATRALPAAPTIAPPTNASRPLSRFPWLFVTARNSSFNLQGPSGGREAGRPRSRRSLRAGRQCAQDRKPYSDRRSAYRCRYWSTSLGGPFDGALQNLAINGRCLGPLAHASGKGLVRTHRGAGREYERKPAALPVSAERGAGG